MSARRHEIVSPHEVSVYHCVSRCVRRAFLCGWDGLTGRSFEHRRTWIRSRLCFLTDIFAVDVIAYAILSNHLHSLLRIRPDIANTWSAEEVAFRWRKLFPLRRVNDVPEQPSVEDIAAITSQPALVEIYRKRLCCISWFNRCLNENIARRANREDDCKGRFWEGRFACQRVYDVAGIIACGVYIDLNPIRAGIAETPEESDHTSIQDRIFAQTQRCSEEHKLWAQIPLVSIAEVTQNRLTQSDYIKLVDETGRFLVEGKARIPRELAPILERMDISSQHWLETTRNYKRMFRRVVGPVQRLREAAARAKKRWLQGLTSAQLAFSSPAVCL